MKYKPIDKAINRVHTVCLSEGAEFLHREIVKGRAKLGLSNYNWFGDLVSKCLVLEYGEDYMKKILRKQLIHEEEKIRINKEKVAKLSMLLSTAMKEADMVKNIKKKTIVRGIQ